jgi:hypothetical protein
MIAHKYNRQQNTGFKIRILTTSTQTGRHTTINHTREI